jgi:hypothetical protein
LLRCCKVIVLKGRANNLRRIGGNAQRAGNLRYGSSLDVFPSCADACRNRRRDCPDSTTQAAADESATTGFLKARTFFSAPKPTDCALGGSNCRCGSAAASHPAAKRLCAANK